MVFILRQKQHYTLNLNSVRNKFHFIHYQKREELKEKKCCSSFHLKKKFCNQKLNKGFGVRIVKFGLLRLGLGTLNDCFTAIVPLTSKFTLLKGTLL